MNTTKIRPTRRAFLNTALACTAIPALPKMTLPGMQFHSVIMGSDISEFFNHGSDYTDDSYEIVPAYTRRSAIDAIFARARIAVARSQGEWPPEREWDIRVEQSIHESDVIESANSWGLDYETTAMRLMGWGCECDRFCEVCGLPELDGTMPTCGGCYRCKSCVDLGETWTDNRLKEQTGKCPDCRW